MKLSNSERNMIRYCQCTDVKYCDRACDLKKHCERYEELKKKEQVVA